MFHTNVTEIIQLLERNQPTPNISESVCKNRESLLIYIVSRPTSAFPPTTKPYQIGKAIKTSSINADEIKKQHRRTKKKTMPRTNVPTAASRKQSHIPRTNTKTTATARRQGIIANLEPSLTHTQTTTRPTPAWSAVLLVEVGGLRL